MYSRRWESYRRREMNKITHVNVKTTAEAVAALGANAAVIAGGTDLYGFLKAQIYSNPPQKLVNIKTIPGMAYIKEEGGMLKIGALTKLTDISESTVVTAKWSSLAEAAGKVGTPQLRNQGTIGGNLCQKSRCWYYRAEKNQFQCLRKGGLVCYMATGNTLRHCSLFPETGSACITGDVSDTAVPLTALGATVVTTKRSIPIADFFTALGNVLDANEIVTEIQVPTPAAGTKQKFIKWAERQALDFAEASVATLLTVSGGTVTDARIVLGGVAPRPRRATDAEAAIKGKSTASDAAVADAAAQAVKGAISLMAYGGNGWKIPIVKKIVKQAIMS
jgi:xanthine dehydrogenase YagS FAD-binding subunit